VHLAVALAFLLLTGCASTRAALPAWAPSFLKPTSIVVPAPASQPSSFAPEGPGPQIVHTLTLVAPSGAVGRLTLTRAINANVTSYGGIGSIRVSDDLGQWTFSYAPVTPRASSPAIQALAVRFEGALAIDWNEGALVDPAGNRLRLDHRADGSATAVWVGDLGFESLPSGQTVTLALTLRQGDQRLARTFVFESRPPETEAPRAAARPIARWVGERFMVLPRPPSRQREPYEGLEVADKVRRHPTPEEIAGAVLTVTRIAYDRLVPLITLVRQDSRQQYTARAPAEVVEGLAPLADVESAQKEWRGKALWLAAPDLNVTGDESADVHVLPVRRLSRVEVVDVQPGWSNLAPLRFMLKTTDGLLGFRDVHTTGTNVPVTERTHHAFERAFLTRDPRAEFDWPAEVWANIEDSRVVTGMTAVQVRLSWGEPPRVERAVSSAGRQERWIYPGPRTLVLVDGLVTDVQP
jgi:hypothetical protein